MFLKNLEEIANIQGLDEVRARYGSGEYEIATEYKKFQADRAHWHSWTESKKRDHVEKLRDYKPTLSDAYEKPKNVGRKPGFLLKNRKNDGISICSSDPMEQTTGLIRTQDRKC